MEKEFSRAKKNMFFKKTQVLTLENPVYPGQGIKGTGKAEQGYEPVPPYIPALGNDDIFLFCGEIALWGA